jgi:hypothetical protein
MFYPLLLGLLLLVLLVAILGGVRTAKRRAIDREDPPDVRPDDTRPSAGLPLR